MPLSSIRLTDSQSAVLEWIKAGCPAGVYDEDEHYSHRLSARALANRGLVKIRGHGPTWVATLTPRGELWPDASEDDVRVLQLDSGRRPSVSRASGAKAADPEEPHPHATAPAPDASVRASRRITRQATKPKKQRPTKIVEKRETYMRYRVMVTRVQVADLDLSLGRVWLLSRLGSPTLVLILSGGYDVGPRGDAGAGCPSLWGSFG